MKVAVLGVSLNSERYAYRAVGALLKAGHEPIGVNPSLPEFPGIPVVASVKDLPHGVHTLTVYLGPEKSSALAEEITGYGFSRAIFNPGSENPALQAALHATGCQVDEACTLVLLATHRFVEPEASPAE